MGLFPWKYSYSILKYTEILCYVLVGCVNRPVKILNLGELDVKAKALSTDCG